MQDFQPGKDAAICRPTETIGLEQEAQTLGRSHEDDFQPKRRRVIRQSAESMSTEGRAQAGAWLKETSSQTDPVVIFVGNVSTMAERLKQLEQWSSQTVFDGNDVLVEMCSEDQLQKRVVPCLQLQRPSQQESDDDVICLDGCPSPEAARVSSIGPDKRLEQGPDVKAEHGSNKRQWQGSNERQEECQNRGAWQDLTDEHCQGPDEKQLKDRPTSTRRLRQTQFGRQGQDQTRRQQHGPSGKQWQDQNEKQWQDQNEKQWQDPNEVQCRDQNVVQFQDPNVVQCRDQNDVLSGSECGTVS